MQELPKWAQQTLKRHAHDPRVLKSQKEIEQATTGDLLWDAMQHQLVTTGWDIFNPLLHLSLSNSQVD
jgi:deoxyribodipyrimidine photolyase